MKKHSMPEMKEGGVNVTPLIDIVMCLIIFFMLVTKIGVSRGEDKDIKLPDAIMKAKIADMGDTITLNVHRIASGVSDIQVTTTVTDKATGQSEKRDLKVTRNKSGKSDLQIVLEAFRESHSDNSTKPPTVHAKVIIRADKELDYCQLEQVLIATAQAGISDTAYETKPGKPGGAE